MERVKLLGLFAIPVVLMAFAGIASATTVTSFEGSTPIIKAESDGHLTFDGPFPLTCSNSTFEAKVAAHGAAVTVEAKISKLTFTNCGANHMTVLTGGTLIAHSLATTGNATLTSTGTQLTITNTSTGISCLYTTNATHIGTFTSATQTMHIDSAQIPRTGHSFFCGGSAEMTGAYKFTGPTLTFH